MHNYVLCLWTFTEWLFRNGQYNDHYSPEMIIRVNILSIMITCRNLSEISNSCLEIPEYWSDILLLTINWIKSANYEVYSLRYIIVIIIIVISKPSLFAKKWRFTRIWNNRTYFVYIISMNVNKTPLFITGGVDVGLGGSLFPAWPFGVTSG